MKLCRFIYGSEIKYGALEDELVRIVPNPYQLGKTEEVKISSRPIQRNEVKFLPPVAPSKIVCVGRNYLEHAMELGSKVPKEPLLFLKTPSALIIDGEEIILPVQAKQVEHEGELGIVIRRKCKNLTEFDDLSNVTLSYICLNDVTARDLQKKDIQFARAKSFDTFCPISSFIETELDISDVRITTKINGEVKQDGRTSQMVFDAPFLIRYISNQMTLDPGDIITTGTPSGVSKLFEGDVCEVEIEGVGVLRNTVIK